MAGRSDRRLRGLHGHLRPAAPPRSTPPLPLLAPPRRPWGSAGASSAPPTPAEIYWGERIAPAIEAARDRPSVRIVQVTDTHTSAQPPSFASGGQLAADISAVIERERPDMVLVTGDLTDRGRTADLEDYRRTIASLPVPVVTLFAGHDGIMQPDDVEDFAAFTHLLGPLCTSCQFGPATLLLYPEAYGFGAAALLELDRWFDEALSHSPVAAGPLVLVTHDPTCFFDNSKPAEHQYGPSVERMRRLRPRGHPPVDLILNGQYHTTRVQSIGGITQVGLASLTMGGIDGSPRSYAVLDLGAAEHTVRLETLRSGEDTGGDDGGGGALRSSDLLWRTELLHGLPASVMALSADGQTLFAATHQFGGGSALAQALAMSARDGSLLWSRDLEAPSQVGLTLATLEHEPVLLLALSNGKLLCLSASDGSQRWQHEMPGFPDRWIYTLPVVDGRTVVVGQPSGSVAVDLSTGSRLWEAGQHWELSVNCIRQFPVVGDDGCLFAVQPHKLANDLRPGNHWVAALVKSRVSDGVVEWTVPLLDTDLDAGLLSSVPTDAGLYQLRFGSPVLAGGLVVVGGIASEVLGFCATTGRRVWRSGALEREGLASGVQPGQLLTVYEQAVALMPHGDDVLVSSSNGMLLCLAASSGVERFRFVPSERAPVLETQPYIRGRGNALTRAAVGCGRIFVGGACGRAWCLDASTGRLLAELEGTSSALLASPVAHDDGSATVADHDGGVRRWSPCI